MRVKSNIIFHLSLVSILATIAVFPFYFRAVVTPPGTFYSYVHRIHEDYYNYLSIIRQGRIQLQEIDQYTTEDLNPSRMHLFYLLWGRLAKYTGISDITAYYAAMAVSFFLLYFFTVKIAGLFFSGKWRYLAILLVFIGAPLPEFIVRIFKPNITPGYDWWTNADIYSRLTYIPHHFFSLGLLLATVYFLLKFIKTRRWVFVVPACLSASFGNIFFAVPGLVFLVGLSGAIAITAVLLLVELLKKKVTVKSLFLRKNIVFATGFFLIFTTAFVSLYLITFPLRTAGFIAFEGKTYNPEVFPYTWSVFLASFGLLPYFLPLAVFSFIRKPSFDKILITCLFIAPFILYLFAATGILSVSKIRFVYGASYVFGAVLTVLAIRWVNGIIKGRRLRFLYLVVIFTLLSSNLFFDLNNYWKRELLTRNFYTNVYIPKVYLQAAKYLNDNTPKFSRVMVNFASGVFLPAFTYSRVYLGHEATTVNFWSKYALSIRFYNRQMSEEEARELLRNNKIEYVFWDYGGLPEAYKSLMVPRYNIEYIGIYKTQNLNKGI